ncbi:MAG: type II secretion system protein GspN [Nitrospirota bacterium]
MLVWIKRKKRAIISVILYLIYGIVLLFIFLYLSFPYDKFERWAVAAIENRTPLQLTIREGSLYLPPGIIWKGVKITHPSFADNRVFEIERMNANIDLFSLFTKEHSIEFAFNTSGGTGNGILSIERIEDRLKYRIDASGEGFSLEKTNLLDKGPQIEGKLKVDIENEWERDFIKGDGESYIEISGLKIKGFKIRDIPIPEFSFPKVVGKITIKGGFGVLKELSAQGMEADISGKGNIIFREMFYNSIINLSFTIDIKEGFKNNLMFLLNQYLKDNRSINISIKGTFKRPVVYINEMELNRSLSLLFG